MRAAFPSFVAVVLALLAFSAAAKAAEPRNQQLVDLMISNVERSSSLVCEKGREPGRLLNPLVCNGGSTIGGVGPGYFPGQPMVCLGTVHYKCKDTSGKKMFKISATYRYVDGVAESMQKMKVTATE